jgi:filamentous hemagglutinin family protein
MLADLKSSACNWGRIMKKIAISFSIISLAMGLELLAGPSGASVVSGDVRIGSSELGQLLVESHSDRAIISWENFSIGRDEVARFQLPDASSAVLNRVTSSLPSTLAGLLESNGHVYLINPNGILVTEEGVINTASFLASTLDLNNSDFMIGGDLLFAGNSQESVINRGQITAWNGDVILLGYTVRNENAIDAPFGTAALGAGSEILLMPQGEERIAIHIPLAHVEASSGTGILQEGTLQAIRAELKAEGNPYALAIQSSGWIKANSSATVEGRVYLIANEGVITHTGTIHAPAGEVCLAADSIGLKDHAEIDVSSAHGGGTILIGAGLHGSGNLGSTASHVYAEQGTSLKADALVEGHGGLIVLWGKESNVYLGRASARGGDLAGNGGLVEVSSPLGLVFNGIVDRRAPFGEAGTLLLDPTDITITNAADSGGAIMGGMFVATAGTANIDVDTLFTNLNLGSVTIDTASAFGGTGDITISSWTPMMVMWTAGNTLTLNAERNIYIGAMVSFDNGSGPSYGNIAMNAGTGGSGTINSDATSTFTTNGSGSITLTSVGPMFGNAVDLLGNITHNSSGDFSISASQGSIVVQPSTLNFGSMASAGSFLISATDPTPPNPLVVMSGTWNFNMGAPAKVYNVSSTGFITQDAVLSYNFPGAFTLESTGGDVNVTNSITFQASSGPETINASGSINFFNAASLSNGSANTTQLRSGIGGSGDIIFGAGSDLGLTSSGEILVTAPVGMGIGSILFNSPTSTITTSGSGSIKLAANGLPFQKAIQFCGNVTHNSSGGFVATTTQGDIQSETSSTITFGALSGAATFTSYAALDFEGPLVQNSANTIQLIAANLANGYLVFGSSSGLTMTSSGNVDMTVGGPMFFGNIWIDAPITASGSGSLSMEVTEGGPNSSAVSINGNILFNSSGDFSIVSNYGNVDIDPMTLDFGTTMMTPAGSFSIQTLTSFPGAVSFSGTWTFTFGGMGESFSIDSLGGTISNATITYAYPGDLIIDEYADININSPMHMLSGSGDLKLTTIPGSNGNINSSNTGTLTFDAGAGALLIDGDGSVNLSGAIDYSSTGNALISSQDANINTSSTASMNFHAGSGGLIASANTDIFISGPIDYSSAVNAVFTMINGSFSQSNTGTIDFHAGAGDLLIHTLPMTGNSINIGGVITFDPNAGKLTITANQDLDITGGIIYNTASSPLSLSGNRLSVESFVTVSTTATTNITSNDVVQVTGQVRNTDTMVGGPININAGGDLMIGNVFAASSTLIGSILADLTFNVGQNILLLGNNNPMATGIYTQIGYDVATTIQSNINFNTVGGEILMVAGGSDGCYILVGHGSLQTSSGTYTGDITFGSMMNPVGGGARIGGLSLLPLLGGEFGVGSVGFPIMGGENAFIQVGHLGGVGAPVLATGDIDMSHITGSVHVIGGGADGQYAMIGHGGLSAEANTFFGNVTVQTSAMTSDIQVISGSASDAFASIGPAIHNQGMGNATIQSDTIDVRSPGSILVQSTSGSEAIIGAYGKSDMGGTVTITNNTAMTTLSIVADSTAGSVVISGDSNTTSFNGAMIGAMAFTGTLPPVAAGSAGCNLQISSGGDLELKSGSAGTSTDTFALVINGNGVPMGGPFNLDLTEISGSALIEGGNNLASIQSIGALALNATGDLLLLAQQKAASLGTAFIQSEGTTSIFGANIAVIGFEGGPAASITNSRGSLDVETTVGDFLVNSNGNVLLTGGTGDLTLNSNKNLTVSKGSTIQKSGSVMGTLNLQCSDNMKIIAGANTLISSSTTGSLTAGQNLFILADNAGDSVVNATNSITVSSTNGGIYLVGFADTMVPHSAAIRSTNGPVLVSANNNISLFSNSNISVTSPMGTGDISIGTVAGDLLLINNSSIQNSGTGDINNAVSMAITSIFGDLFIRGGTFGDAFIEADQGSVNLTIGNDLFLQGVMGGGAKIEANGTSTIATTGLVKADGTFVSPMVAYPAQLISNAGDFTITGSGISLVDTAEITLNSGGSSLTISTMMGGGDISLFNNCVIQNLGTVGTTNTAISSGNDLYLLSGANGSATLSASSTLSLSTVGDATLSASSGGAVFVQSSGNTTITIGSNLIVAGLFSGMSSSASTITNSVGTLSVTAGTINMADFAIITQSGGAGTLSVTTTVGDLRMANNASITHSGTGGIDLATGGIAGDLIMLGGVHGNANITGSSSNNINVQATNIYLSGSSSTNGALITTVTGALIVSSSGYMELASFGEFNSSGAMGMNELAVVVGTDLTIANGSLVQNLGLGLTTVSIGGDLDILGSGGSTGIHGGTGLTQLVIPGNVNITSTTEGGFIFAQGELQIAGNAMGTVGVSSLSLVGQSSSFEAAIYAGSGPLTILSTNDITQLTNGNLYIPSGANAISVTSDMGSVSLNDGSGIFHGGTGAITLSAFANVIAEDNSLIAIASGANTLSITTATGDLLLDNSSAVENNGTGLVTATIGGDLLIRTSELQSAMGSVTLDITGNLFVQSNSMAQGLISAGNTLSINDAASITLTSPSPMHLAQISSRAGSLSITTSGPIDLASNSKIALLGGTTFDMALNSGGDLLVSNNSTILSAGTGLMTVNVSGSATLLAGAGNALITSGSPLLALIDVVGNIFMLSDANGSAGVNATVGPVTVTTSSGSIYLFGYPSSTASHPASISSSGGDIIVNANQNLILVNNANITAPIGSGGVGLFISTGGNLTIDNSSMIQNLDSGPIFFPNIGANLYVRSGPNGSAFITTDSMITFFGISGELTIEADSNRKAYITAGDDLSLSAGSIAMTGYSSAVPSYIEVSNGALTVEAGRIDLDDFAHISLTSGSGAFQVNASLDDISLSNGSYLQNAGTGTTSSMINGTLYLQGGPSGAASFLCGSNASTINADAIVMKGTTALYNAVLTATSGNLTIETVDTMSLVTFATVGLTSPMGSGQLSINAGTDLLVANESLISNAGTGQTLVTVDGVGTVLGGIGDASIQSIGNLTVSAGNNLHVISDLNGKGYIKGTHNVAVNAGADFFMAGAPEAGLNAFVQSLTGDLLLTATNSVTLLDRAELLIASGSGTLEVDTTNFDFNILNGSFVKHSGTGPIVATIVGNIQIQGGQGGDSYILSPSTLTLDIIESMTIEAVTDAKGYLQSAGTTTITVDQLLMDGFDVNFTSKITTTGGNLTLNANRVDLLNYASILLSGSGNLNIGLDAADLRISNSSFIQNSGSGDLNMPVPGMLSTALNSFILVGGPGGPASVKGGSGVTTLNAGQVQLTGFSPTNNALLSAASGVLNVASTTTVFLNPYSGIKSFTGAGALNVDVGTNLLISNGSSITHLGTGNISVDADGYIAIFGGTASSSITGKANVNVSSGGNLRLIADFDGDAFITSTGIGGAITIDCDGDLFIAGSVDATKVSYIKTANGTLTVNVGNNLNIQDGGNITVNAGASHLILNVTGDLNVENGSFITNLGTGNITGTIDGNLLVTSGALGNTYIASKGALTLGPSMMMPAGNILLEAVQGGDVYISSNGITNISADKLLLFGYDAASTASIRGTTGAFTIAAQTINVIDFSDITLLGGSGAFNITASTGDFRVANRSTVENKGSGVTHVNATMGTLYVQGGASGASAVKGNTADTTITGGYVLLSGFTNSFTGTISAVAGDLLINATLVNMTPFSKILLTGPGAMGDSITLNSDLIRFPGSTAITNSIPPGTVTVTGTTITCM